MRWLVGFFLLLGAVVFGAYVFVKGYPYGLYSSWMQGENWNHYYSINGFRPLLLRPNSSAEIPPYQEDYGQLWRNFQLRNSLIPLPTRHPEFITVPIVELKNKDSAPYLGMSFLSSSGREISRLYTLSPSLARDYTHGQELFKLPFVRNRILKKNLDDLWKDIFTYEIEVKSKNMDEMIHDLYILHLRSKILPPQTIHYSLINDNRALIELDSEDKDYMVELVLTQVSGNIYSYILKTEKQSVASKKLRAKFLSGINFSPADPAMGRLLYTEFKQLNFARQVDQEGMLYLFSAWTQDIDKMEMLKEMIFYLERGKNNNRQLKPLYEYALKKFGKTFSTRNIFHESEDPELVLNRKIEIERIEKVQKLQNVDIKAKEIELSPDEKMNLYLKKAKEIGPVEGSDMTVH